MTFEKHRRAAWLIRLLLAMILIATPIDLTANLHPYVLPSNLASKLIGETITRIYRDRDGFLWVATQNGVYMFYGNQNFDHYGAVELSPSISDIRDIFEDNFGKLVLATFGSGLLSWNNDLGKFDIQDSGISERHFYRVLKTHSGQFWTLGLRGLRLLSSDLSSEINWLENHPNYKRLNQVNVIARLDDNRILAGGKTQLFVCDTEQKSIVPILNTHRSLNVTALHVVGNSIYVGTGDGDLLVLDAKNFALEDEFVAVSSRDDPITNIASLDGDIWGGSNSGLYRINMKTGRVSKYSIENSKLTNDHITALEQIDSALWIGTYHGLNHMMYSPILRYDKANSDIHNDVMDFAQEEDGSIFVATFNGIYRRQSLAQNMRHSRIDQGTAWNGIDRRFMTVEVTPENIWLGTWSMGVVSINQKTALPEVLNLSDLANSSITDLNYNALDGLWIATYQSGLFRLHKGSLTRYPKIGVNPVTLVYQTVDGHIVAASQNSLLLYSRETDSFSRLEVSHNNSAPELILCVVESVDGQILVGTKDRGIYTYDSFDSLLEDESVEPNILSSYLNNQSIFGITYDRNGNLWTATNNGIVVLGKDNQVLQHYHRSDGLQSNDFNFGAFFLSNTGQIYAGGPNGYNVINPPVNYSRPSSRRTAITAFRSSAHLSHISSSYLSRLQDIEVPERHSDLEFQFAVQDFLNPALNSYKFKLIGYDVDWIPSGNKSEASYPPLTVGSYVFKVLGANSAGIWSDQPASIRIQVVPNWWQTPLAYGTYLLSLIVLAILLMRWYRTHLQRNAALALADHLETTAYMAQNELEEIHEYQEEVVQAIRNQTQTTLSTIRTCLDALPNTSNASRSIAGYLDCLGLLEMSFHCQSGYLLTDLHKFTSLLSTQLLGEHNATSGSVIDINRVTTKLIPADVATPLAIIIYELFDNALSHAFTSESPVNYIQVVLDWTTDAGGINKRYHLCVTDDGIGLPPDFDPLTHNSPGFTVIRTLSEAIDADIADKSTEEETTIEIKTRIDPEE